MGDTMEVREGPFDHRHVQYETRHLDVFAGVSWHAWALGIEIEVDDSDDLTLFHLAVRLGPFYAGFHVTR